MAERLLDAFSGAAARLYGGEPVTELAHSLQCAELARDAGADEDLQLACLLHDVGRFAVDPREIFDKKDGKLGARGRVATTTWEPTSSRRGCRREWRDSCACTPTPSGTSARWSPPIGRRSPRARATR